MTGDYQQLWKSLTNATDKTVAVRILAEIVADREGRTFVMGLGSEAAKLCIETLDYGMVGHNLRSREKASFFLALRRLAERHELLPDRMMITKGIDISEGVIASGAFGDVRRARYLGQFVAVNTMNISARDNFHKIRKRFCREVVLWSTLTHPNVLRFVGVQNNMEKRVLATVSEWIEHGNIMDYIKIHHVNRLELLCGAAQGLKYLHDARVTHGNLSGDNILVSNDTPPRACLADFGFMASVPDPSQQLACSAQLEGGKMTFMSPELLIPEEVGRSGPTPTPQADVYAFGLVIFQVLTGEIPFRGIPQSALGFYVHRGDRPLKPDNASAIGFSDSLWHFTERCWDGKAESRPGAREVVTHLMEAAARWSGVMPPSVQADDAASDSTSDSDKLGRVFRSSSNFIPEATTESQMTRGPFTPPITPPILFAEPAQVGPQGFVSKPLKEPQPESLIPAQSRSEELPGDLPTTEAYPHLNERYDRAPSPFTQARQRGVTQTMLMLRKFWGLGP